MKNIDLGDVPKGIWLAVAIIAVNITVYLFGIMPLEEEASSTVAQTTQLETRMRQLRTQAQSIRRDVSDVKALQGDYNAIIAAGFLNSQNRLDAVKKLDELREKHAIEQLQFRFDEEIAEPVDRQGAVSQEFEIVYTPIELDSEAMLDSDLLAFWHEVVTTIPNHYRIQKAEITRKGNLGREEVNQLRVGKAAPLVTGKMRFDWVSLRKRSPEQAGQKGPTPPAQPGRRP